MKLPIPLRRVLTSPLARELASIAIYALLTFGFFWQLLLEPGSQVPEGGGDLASFLYPVYSFAARSLQQGVIPLWNPYLYSGSPFAADMQSGLFYPPNLLAFLLARPFTYATLEALALLHYFLAACFTYTFARGLGLGRLPSFGVGLIFAFSGSTVARLGNLNTLAAAIWLPLILFFFHRAMTRARLIWAVAAGVAYGLSILAGHLHVSLFLALFLSLYWLWGLSFRQRVGTCLLALPATFLVAFGVAALQLLPSLELISLSLRSELTYARAVEFSASPLGFITLLVPLFFGDNPSAYWGLRWSLTEVYGYIGVLPLLLIPLGLLLRPIRDSRLWFFAAAAALFFLLSLGEHTPLYGWAYRFLPGFDKVRAPGRILFLFDFAAAVLAGFGLQALSLPIRQRARPLFRLFLASVGVLLGAGALVIAPLFYYALLTSQDKDPVIFQRVALALNSLNLTLFFLAASFALLLYYRYRSRYASLVPYLALGIIVLDLFSAGLGFLRTTTQDVTRGYLHPEVIRFLKGQDPPFRIDSVTGVWDVWQPDTSLLYGLEDVMGIYNPMTLADYDRYWASLGSRSVPAYDLLNAKYVVARKDVTLDWSKFTPVLSEDPQLTLYLNRATLPRAMVVPQAEVLPREEILARLRSPTFDPQRLVLLEPDAQPPLSSSPSGYGEAKVISLERPSPNEVLVRVYSSQPAYLVLSEVFYPGWRAYLDGRQTRLLRANYIFRAVALSEGDHEVSFRFDPPLWKLGLAITTITWLAVLLLALGFALRRRA